MALAGRTRYPRPIYPKSSSQMPDPAPFMALASTSGRWNLASRAPAFQECRSTDLYLRWWGRSYILTKFYVVPKMSVHWRRLWHGMLFSWQVSKILQGSIYLVIYANNILVRLQCQVAWWYLYIPIIISLLATLWCLLFDTLNTITHTKYH
jgi:hypothetical protein